MTKELPAPNASPEKPLIVVRPLVERRPDGTRVLHVLPVFLRGRREQTND